MALKGKVERLRQRLPAKREPHTLVWFSPDTGEITYELTTTPTPDGRGHTISEYWSADPPDHPAKAAPPKH